MWFAHAPTSAANFARSMLPPETTATILPRPARPLSAAAIAQPAAPSAITRARSAASVIARATSSSETTIEPASCDSSGHIVGSTDLPPAPSTNDACQLSKYTGRPAGERRRQRRRRFRFGGVDARAGLQFGDGRGDAGEQSAAAERRDDRVDVRQIFEDLESGRGVAGDESVVVERVDEMAGHPRSSRAIRPSASTRRRCARTIEAPSRSIARIFVCRRGVHHHHRAARAQLVCAANADALGGVAGADRPHAVAQRFRRQLADDVVRAADLERPDRLQRLELQVQLRSVRQLDADEGSADGGSINCRGSVADIGEWNGALRRGRGQGADRIIGLSFPGPGRAATILYPGTDDRNRALHTACGAANRRSMNARSSSTDA